MKWQKTVLRLIFVFLQELHMLPGQMNLLKYKKKNFVDPCEIVPTRSPLELVLPTTFLCLCSKFSTITIFNYFTKRNSLSCRTAYSTDISITIFSIFISWIYWTTLPWFPSSFSIPINRVQTFVSEHHDETNFYLVSRKWNINAANLIKSSTVRTGKKNLLLIEGKKSANCKNHYRWNDLSYIEVL